MPANWQRPEKLVSQRRAADCGVSCSETRAAARAIPFSSVTVTASFDNGEGAGGLPVFTCGRAATDEASKDKIANFCQNRVTVCQSPFGSGHCLVNLLKISRGGALDAPLCHC